MFGIFLSMTGLAGPGGFRVSVAANARNRIHASVDTVTAQVITAVGRSPAGLCLVSQGRFKLDAHPMARIAVTRGVAHGTDPLVLPGNRPMVLRKIDRVHETAIGKFAVGGFMAVQALPEIFFRILIVPGRDLPIAGSCSAGHYQNRDCKK
jgi:hypothetical protein